MRQFITAGLTLAAICSDSGNCLAYINYPWCVFGEGRGTDCSYRSKEECAHSGRSRGFGSQCHLNTGYNPKLPYVVEQPPIRRPSNVPGSLR
jgi:Protein of unknown function (DUF3551)